MAVPDSVLTAVFNNLSKLVQYRNITKVAFSTKEFLQDIATNDYVYLTGERTYKQQVHKVYIILVAPDSKISKTLAEFRKMFLHVVSKKDSLIDVCIITHNLLSASIKRTIDKEFAEEYENSKLYFENYSYDKFKIVIPESKMVPHHFIADEAAVKAELNIIYQKISDLPKIYDGDPAAVWIGAKPGDIVAIDRCSETCGLVRNYRLCIRGTL